jgi:hypothetical protein
MVGSIVVCLFGIWSETRRRARHHESVLPAIEIEDAS